MLEQEINYYNQQLSQWLDHFTGRFVLIKGSELIGTFDTQADALAEGARRFGLQSFLVRRVEPTQPNVSIPALSLGILRANPTYTTSGSSTNA